MNSYKLLIVLLFNGLMIISNNLFSQNIDIDKLPLFYNEVYGESEYELSSDITIIYTEYLSRISFIKQGFEKNESYPLLSTVGRKDKYNANLKYDLTDFDLNLFNPLKYHFNYNKSINQFYRIDNTDFLLMIKSTN